jgi:UDP-N-acetylmuramoyl-tripeptide--D-alanyl-D-alanine ligase
MSAAAVTPPGTPPLVAHWPARDLREATGGMMRAPFEAAGVSIDTRTLQPGELFVALRGENGDGHAHVADALARGAAGALVHEDAGEGPFLLVDDTLAGLQRLGAFARARFLGRLVAVTGSVGKTTTKEMLRVALGAHGATHAAVASYNNHWGVPLTLARLAPEAAFCVAEIGMNHAGEIAPLARLARPHVALITNAERVHVGHLGSLTAIADEKATLLEGLVPDGVAVLPAEGAMATRLRAAAKGRVLTFGTAAGADARLAAVAADATGTRMEVAVGGAVVRLRLAAVGAHMALNATAALACVAALGLDVARAARALDGFAAVTGRGARRTIPVAGGTAVLLDESYNASPVSVRAALAVLGLQTPAAGGRRIAVLGDMLELGAEGAADHAALAPDVTASADLLFACGPLTRALCDAVPAAMVAAHAPDAAALAPVVRAALRPGDVVLVKGSLGSRMRTIVAALESAGGEAR